MGDSTRGTGWDVPALAETVTLLASRAASGCATPLSSVACFFFLSQTVSVTQVPIWDCVLCLAAFPEVGSFLRSLGWWGVNPREEKGLLLLL